MNNKTIDYDLRAYWMPYTSNTHFKSEPRMFVKAKGIHWYTDDGREVIDGTSGLWCVNCGHCHPTIVKAIQEQIAELDFCPTFQLGHPKVFELCTKLAKEVFPEDLNTIFLANSGSEAVESAIKIALAYWKHKGQENRKMLIGRARGYHGVNMGGTSVGGIPNNLVWFNNLLNVDRIRETHDLARNAFSHGVPEHGKEFAEDLLSKIEEHGAENIAAVFIEPIAGSTGVLIPPVGYLERIREICTQHDILLIFDEVITGFGRTGEATASQRFGVIPDMITFAKGVNSASIPMGGVAVKDAIYDLFMEKAPEKTIDFFHGYTYSGHPMAVAAALGALEVYKKEGLFTRARELETHWEEQIHSLKDYPHVIDIRNFGLIGAIELQPSEGKPTARAYEAFCDAFHNKNLLIRTTGDIIALSPPLVIDKDSITEIFNRLKKVLTDLD